MLRYPAYCTLNQQLQGSENTSEPSPDTGHDSSQDRTPNCSLSGQASLELWSEKCRLSESQQALFCTACLPAAVSYATAP